MAVCKVVHHSTIVKACGIALSGGACASSGKTVDVCHGCHGNCFLFHHVIMLSSCFTVAQVHLDLEEILQHMNHVALHDENI